MKLRNKLIPVLSVATLATTVAPMAASCGTVTLNGTEMIDVLHGYNPTIARADAWGYTTDEAALELYVDHVKKNPEIMAQDIACYEAQVMKSRINFAALGYWDEGMITDPEDWSGDEYGFMGDISLLYGLIPATYDPEDYKSVYSSFNMIPQVAKFGVSDIKIDQVTLYNTDSSTPGKAHKIYTISMKFNYQFEYEIQADCKYGINRYTVTRNTKASLTSEYKNIPFTVRWDAETASWMVEPIGWAKLLGEKNQRWILQKHQNYCLDFDFKCITTDTVKDFNNNVDTYTYDDSQAGSIDSYAKLMNWISSKGSKKDYERLIRDIVFNFSSYHLYDITGPQWSTSNLFYGADNDLGYTGEATGSAAEGWTSIKYYNKYAFNRNWTYAEYLSGHYPQTDKTHPHKLAADVTQKPTLYMDKDGEDVEVGTVEILAADNTNMLTPGTDEETSLHLDLVLNFIPKEGETFPGDLNLDDYTQFKFTLPKGTTFKINIWKGDEESYKTPEEFTLTEDVEWNWSAIEEAHIL